MSKRLQGQFPMQYYKNNQLFNYQLIIFLNVSFSHPKDGEVGYCSFLRTGKEIKFIIYVLSPSGKFQLI